MEVKKTQLTLFYDGRRYVAECELLKPDTSPVPQIWASIQHLDAFNLNYTFYVITPARLFFYPANDPWKDALGNLLMNTLLHTPKEHWEPKYSISLSKAV